MGRAALEVFQNARAHWGGFTALHFVSKATLDETVNSADFQRGGGISDPLGSNTGRIFEVDLDC